MYGFSIVVLSTAGDIFLPAIYEDRDIAKRAIRYSLAKSSGGRCEICQFIDCHQYILK